jgi:hypothetical protein
MITIHEKTQSITIMETCQWDNVFSDIYNEIKNSVKDEIEYEDTCYDEEEIQNIKKYLSYTPTAEDKVAMLKYLKDIYEWEDEHAASRGNYSVSLFDQRLIREAVREWIQEVFLFEVRPWYIL